LLLLFIVDSSSSFLALSLLGSSFAFLGTFVSLGVPLVVDELLVALAEDPLLVVVIDVAVAVAVAFSFIVVDVSNLLFAFVAEVLSLVIVIAVTVAFVFVVVAVAVAFAFAVVAGSSLLVFPR
jgi:hypothetical protein